MFLALWAISSWCQNLSYYVNGLELLTEGQYSGSDGTTPLWLNANKYGLSSLDSKNGYFRVSAIRPIEVDSNYNWRIGYGVDLALAGNYTSTIVVNQAFVEFGYKKARITIGSKRQHSPMTNQELSSGALLYGWNSRPVPQARLDIDWFSFPGTKGWWKWRLNGSYGITTDGNWQKGFAGENQRYTNSTLYHEKALYWKFGKEDARLPLTYELGLQMAAQFGGTTYNATGRGHSTATTIEHPVSFKTFIDVLTCQGSDETDGVDQNTGGNHVGSWIMRLTYHGYDWKVAARFERYFDDQSMMFIQYGIYDHLLGLDVSLPNNSFLTDITVEHLSTKNQSGAVYHDATVNMPDKMNGIDNYYNHHLYTGWQHWGQAIGSPLLTSPIYNTSGQITFTNNRVQAWHFGVSGDPCYWLHWRVLATLTKNWGTYKAPLNDMQKQNYFLIGLTANPDFLKGWQIDAAIGLDHGDLVGNNKGFQITISRLLGFSFD